MRETLKVSIRKNAILFYDMELPHIPVPETALENLAMAAPYCTFYLFAALIFWTKDTINPLKIHKGFYICTQLR